MSYQWDNETRDDPGSADYHIPVLASGESVTLEAKPAPKKKTAKKLTTEDVLATLQSIGGSGTTREVTEAMFGNQNRQGAVSYHLRKLVSENTLRVTGTRATRTYHLNKAKASNLNGSSEVSLGGLFEVVGKIGPDLAVRSLDTYEIFVLTEV